MLPTDPAPVSSGVVGPAISPLQGGTERGMRPDIDFQERLLVVGSRTKLVAFAIAVVVATAIGVARGDAANITATATVNAGSLTLTSSAAPSTSVTLNGTDQSPT